MNRVLFVLALSLLLGCSSDTGEQGTAAPTPPDTPVQPAQQSTETAPLDLSREVLQQEMAADSEVELIEPDTTLPDLFAEQEEDKQTKLSGKVLINDEATDPRAKVDGVQIELEVPTR